MPHYRYWTDPIYLDSLDQDEEDDFLDSLAEGNDLEAYLDWVEEGYGPSPDEYEEEEEQWAR